MPKSEDKNDFGRKLQKAIVSGDVLTVKRLIKGGVDVNSQTFSLSTWYETSVLHHAVSQDKAEIVKLLLTAKANVNAQNQDGRTPLHLAARSGNVEIIRELIRANAMLDTKTTDNRTALHVAAWRGHTEVVRSLVLAGANVNVPDEGNWTPLYWAAKLNYREIAKILVQNGAILNCRVPKTNFTPLHEALYRGHVGMAKYLIHEGVDPNICTGEESVSKLLLHNSHHMPPETFTDMLDFCISHGYDITRDRSITKSTFPECFLNCEKFAEWLNNQRKLIFGLADLCRKKIRKSLIDCSQGRSIKEKVDNFPLPVLIKDFIKFEGECLEIMIPLKKL